MRNWIITGLKLAVVAGLLFWLVDSGKLHFQQLALLAQDPVIFTANLALWTCCSLFLGSFRWFMLLRGLDLRVAYTRVLRFQLIGFFFNTAMPGAVGGDIVKAIYVVREQNAQSKTPAMLTVLLDRIIGLAALFVLAGIAVAANASLFFGGENNNSLAPLAIFIILGLLGLAVGFALIMVPFPPGKDPFVWLFSRKLPGFGMLHKIYVALRCYRNRPLILVGALALSCFIQSCAIAYTLLLTERLTGQTPSWGLFGTIIPIGTMTTALPLAPGGLGVGHVAFDRLFAIAGLTGGANVFNVMVLGQLALNLIGFIPYILHRTKLPNMQEMQTELENATVS